MHSHCDVLSRAIEVVRYSLEVLSLAQQCLNTRFQFRGRSTSAAGICSSPYREFPIHSAIHLWRAENALIPKIFAFQVQIMETVSNTQTTELASNSHSDRKQSTHDLQADFYHVTNSHVRVLIHFTHYLRLLNIFGLFLLFPSSFLHARQKCCMHPT